MSAAKLGLKVCHIHVGAKKIDCSTFKTFGIVLANFQLEDKLDRAQSFQKRFFLANISMDIVLGLPFLTLNNANIQFMEKELIWSSYIISKALLITKLVELINKKKFAKIAWDENFEIFGVYIVVLKASLLGLSIQPDKKDQITFPLIQKVIISDHYSNFTNVFSGKKTLVLP